MRAQKSSQIRAAPCRNVCGIFEASLTVNEQTTSWKFWNSRWNRAVATSGSCHFEAIVRRRRQARKHVLSEIAAGISPASCARKCVVKDLRTANFIACRKYFPPVQYPRQHLSNDECPKDKRRRLSELFWAVQWRRQDLVRGRHKDYMKLDNHYSLE